MGGSRVENSVRNVFAAWGGQAVSVIATFVVRMVFVQCLAQEYVGIESLFSSVLTILALADLGIGSAIVYALYDPIARNDKSAVKSLMRLFKRAYITIGCVIILLGAILTPNVHYIIGADAPNIPHLELYFFCFVLNTGISYFFSYKGSLIYAHQKSYVVFLITYAFQIALSCVQIAVLLLTHNYLLFLVCMLTSTLLTNVCIAIKSNKMYPYILEKDVEPVAPEVLEGVKKNVLGLIMHKVAGVASTPVSNLVITGFVGLSTTAVYGNYLLIVNALTRVVNRMFDSIIASVGNLGAQGTSERQFEVFQTTFFINAIVYAVLTGGLLCSFNAFIEYVWINQPGWTFPGYIVVLVALLFYSKGMRDACATFTSAYGLYWYTKWKAVLEAIFLPLLSMILVIPFGIAGVLAAGILSSTFISTTYEGWAVFRHGLHRPLRIYFAQYLNYAFTGLGAVAIAYVLCELIGMTGPLAFFVNGLIGVSVPLLVYLLLYGRSRECKEFVSIAKRIFSAVFSKLRKKKPTTPPEKAVVEAAVEEVAEETAEETVGATVEAITETVTEDAVEKAKSL